MNAHIDNFLLNNSFEFEHAAEKFEMLKVMIRSETIEYSNKINHIRNNTVEKLIHEIKKLDSEIVLNHHSKEILSALESKKKN